MARKGWVLGNSAWDEILAGIVKSHSTSLQDYLSHELGLCDCYWCPQSLNLCCLLVPLFLSTVLSLHMRRSSSLSWELHHHSMPNSQVSLLCDTWPERQKVKGNILRNVLFFYEKSLSVGCTTCSASQTSGLILANISTSKSFFWSVLHQGTLCPVLWNTPFFPLASCGKWTQHRQLGRPWGFISWESISFRPLRLLSTSNIL